jgi:hypothetical protein
MSSSPNYHRPPGSYSLIARLLGIAKGTVVWSLVLTSKSLMRPDIEANGYAQADAEWSIVSEAEREIPPSQTLP